MMGINAATQYRFVYVNLDDFVPHDHLLRQINQLVDFSFIYQKVSHLYSPFGRRSIDPVLLMKMLLIGYLYGIDSERKLEEEVRLNIAYRWFLGLDLESPIPDHSTFSQNRRRRFKDNTTFQEIFDHVVRLCIEKGIVTGKVIVTDSTHIKASASSYYFTMAQVEKEPAEYLKGLEEEAKKLEMKMSEQREQRGHKKPGKERQQQQKESKEVKRSCSDPDAGFMNRPGKPTGFHYLAHTSVDPTHGIITDIFATAGNLKDDAPFVSRLARQKTDLKLPLEKVGADKGYDYTHVHYGLHQLDIKGYIATSASRSSSEHGLTFQYDKNLDSYTCPKDHTLPFTHLTWDTNKKTYYKSYTAKAKHCNECSLRSTCFSSKTNRRKINKPIAHELGIENEERSRTKEYKKIQKQRKVWCEGTFGWLKEKHNLRKTYKRGIVKIQEQCLFSALAINLKRMVKALN
ncbi:transposase [Paenibacillus sp. V4I9]|uniref:IS1182 family transposase n=1 Tax=Paenibacillus sp. V4I9 TaxID=3042308 RepID=UPI00278560DE|nr:IS1182 family transposase [Paenibacillus sp. V4I9]MDQ0888882.1 transposase [Paenibacillus sp. V4I9]